MQAKLESIVSVDKGGENGPFLCLPCFNQLEKISKLKANLRHLSEDVEGKMKATASRLSISVASSGEKLSFQPTVYCS